MVKIFEKLDDLNICYAVGVAMNKCRFYNFTVGRDYFIMIHKKHKDKFGKHTFKKSPYKNVVIKQMTLTEIKTFKLQQGKYVKVIHSKDGRIYELKNNSLKARL